MTKPMTEQEAVEVLKAFARWEIVGEGTPSRDEIIAALAALDGKHIYASRFKPGDAVHIIDRITGLWEYCFVDRADTISITNLGIVLCAYPDTDCFPTREEAEAECQRRNQKGA